LGYIACALEELQQQHKLVCPIGFLNAMVDGAVRQLRMGMSKISWMIG